MLSLKGKYAEASLEEMSDLVLERLFRIPADTGNTRTQSAAEHGNVTIGIKSDRDSPVVSH